MLRTSSHPQVLLVGSPNVGKTTLFNRLTGSTAKVVNYPGSTVEVAKGHFIEQKQVRVIDTPGIDWLPQSLDRIEDWWSDYREESITWIELHKLIARPQSASEPDAPFDSSICFVFDADQPAKQLVLLSQLVRVLPSKVRLTVAVTMLDHLRSRNGEAFFKALQLGLKPIEVLNSDRMTPGSVELQKLIGSVGTDRSRLSLGSQHPPLGSDHPLMEADFSFLKAESELRQWMNISDHRNGDGSNSNESRATQGSLSSEVQAGRESGVGQSSGRAGGDWDRWLLGSWLSPLIFMVVMLSLFYSVYAAAAPMMEAIESFFVMMQTAVWDAAEVYQLNQTDTGNLIVSLVADGVIGGFSAVATFAPQIFILFLGLGLLEGSGYLARAASLIDRPLQWIGLGGRSFVPVLSGFACAVPAMMACRQIRSEKERRLALWVLPLMTCSARVPVFALMIGLLLGDDPLSAGLAMAGLYLLGLIIGCLASLVASRIISNSVGQEGGKAQITAFCLEIPKLRWPSMVSVLRSSFKKTKSYVVKAGGLIFTLSLLLWSLSNFPDYTNADSTQRMENSYATQMGRLISPVFEPMGGDWRTGAALISAFAAREVFVATLGVLFPPARSELSDGAAQTVPTSSGGEGEPHVDPKIERDDSIYLRSRLKHAVKPNGEPLFTTAATLALTVFFLIALQCLSTFAIAVKESGSYRFALAQLVAFNGAAYLLAVVTYKIFS